MKPPFDIAADLDTPVSAYLKLAPFRPRFLLESVEGGERLARYSFIGFGDCLEVRIEAGGAAHRRRASRRARNRKQEFLDVLRAALAGAPVRNRKFPACPCWAVWWAIRPTMRCATSSACPAAASTTTETPHAHYVAPRSLLVFDHLTRGVALLHDGSEAERQSLRREVIRGAARRRAGDRDAGTILARPRLR